MRKLKPLDTSTTIELARAALAAYFDDHWPEAKPTRCNPGVAMNHRVFLDTRVMEVARAADIRHALEVKIPEYLKHQRYGDARDALQRTIGGIRIAGFIAEFNMDQLLIKAVGEEKKVAVRARGEKVRHEILFFGIEIDDAHAAALLSAVLRRVGALDVAARGEDEN